MHVLTTAPRPGLTDPKEGSRHRLWLAQGGAVFGWGGADIGWVGAVGSRNPAEAMRAASSAPAVTAGSGGSRPWGSWRSESRERSPATHCAWWDS
jgi:hypothetical protein